MGNIYQSIKVRRATESNFLVKLKFKLQNKQGGRWSQVFTFTSQLLSFYLVLLLDWLEGGADRDLSEQK